MFRIIRYLQLIIFASIVAFSTGCEKEKEEEKKPTLTTTTVTNINETSASSGGDITDEGSSTVTSRGVCWSTSSTPTISDNKTSDGAGAGSFSSTIESLFGGTEYFVRAYATNSSGTGYGMALSFSTTGQPPSAPSVNILDATNVQVNSAQLNGNVNANHHSTIVEFEFGTTTSYGSVITVTQSPIDGYTSKEVSANLSDLEIGTTYHFRIKAVNSLGTTYSDDNTFTTLGQVPTASIKAARNISIDGAELNGTVNPNYVTTVVTFEYGLNDSYGSSITASQSPVEGSSDTDVSVAIAGLTIGTTYYYRVKAVNSLGTTYSDDITFKTLGQIPTVSTEAATNIITDAAQLNGHVYANYSTTVVTFEYGLTESYGSTVTATQSPIEGSAYTNVSANITGLTIGTTYHYRIIGVNSLGTSIGSDMTFATAPSSVTDVDGNTYDVVVIGTQVWIAANLKTTKYNDNSDIPLVTGDTDWRDLETPAYCWYENDIANKSLYGALYNWHTINKSTNGNKNVCPTGWHVPSASEWTILENYLIANGYNWDGTTTDNKIAKSLASISGWDASETLGAVGNDQSSNNSSGFNGLPSGIRYNHTGEFNYIGYLTRWWSSSVYTKGATQRGIESASYILSISGAQYTGGKSIRCIRD